MKDLYSFECLTFEKVLCTGNFEEIENHISNYKEDLIDIEHRPAIVYGIRNLNNKKIISLLTSKDLNMYNKKAKKIPVAD